MRPFANREAILARRSAPKQLVIRAKDEQERVALRHFFDDHVNSLPREERAAAVRRVIAMIEEKMASR